MSSEQHVKCPLCRKQFSSDKGLQNHLRMCTKKHAKSKKAKTAYSGEINPRQNRVVVNNFLSEERELPSRGTFIGLTAENSLKKKAKEIKPTPATNDDTGFEETSFDFEVDDIESQTIGKSPALAAYDHGSYRAADEETERNEAFQELLIEMMPEEYYLNLTEVEIAHFFECNNNEFEE